jgi:hypothetical protein
VTRLLAATADGVWSEDGGRVLAGRRIVGLAPVDGGWLALDASGDVWADGGTRRVSWPDPGLQPTCVVAPARDQLFIGTRQARLFRVAHGQVARLASFDQAEGRDSWYTPWGAPPDARSLAAVTPNDVYVNVHVGGILRSDDGGESWVPTIDVDADVHQVVAPATADGEVLAATAYGLARSHDRGVTWSFHTEGLHAHYSRAVAVAGDWLLLSASTGPRTKHAAVYRRPLGNQAPFERCRAGLPEWFEGNIDTGCLAAEGSVAALATADGAVFVSEDAGATWEQAVSGLGSVTALALHPG